MASIIRVSITRVGYNNFTRQLCKVSIDKVSTDFIFGNIPWNN